MSKNLIKSISKIVEESGTHKITIFTNHLKIDGQIFIPEGRCEECHDDFITLENALVCRLNDYCTCEEDDCKQQHNRLIDRHQQSQTLRFLPLLPHSKTI